MLQRFLFVCLLCGLFLSARSTKTSLNQQFDALWELEDYNGVRLVLNNSIKKDFLNCHFYYKRYLVNSKLA